MKLPGSAVVVAAALGLCGFADPPVATVATAKDAPKVSLGTGDIVFLTPDSSKALAQLKLIENAGYRTPLHVHSKTDESFYVLEGQWTLFVDGRTRTLGPGDYALVPKGTPHAQGNMGKTPAVVLIGLAPADFTAFFHERAELVKTTPPGHPDYIPRMMDLGNRHDIKVIGPAPF